MLKIFISLPLFLILTGIAFLSMLPIAVVAIVQEQFHIARSFFYASLLGSAVVGLITLSMLSRPKHSKGSLSNLGALFGAFSILPIFLAVPFHQAVQNTSFLNAYFEMVSSITTTGTTLFDEIGRLPDVLHLWRAFVGWMGGLLIWVSAAAVLAPLNLGGFEITATAEPGQNDSRLNQFEGAESGQRMWRNLAQLFPIYAGLTGLLWLLLIIAGGKPITSLIHAMSTLATSGISSVGGLENAQSGMAGEFVIFLFLLFALSRLTFSNDTMVGGRQSILKDPEFRIGFLLVLGVPALLFMRHWLAALDVETQFNLSSAFHALWGSVFTVLSFLSTTGFESSDWSSAQEWSGLETPRIILLGLALMGGGVATTAGGVKLLRVYALYLNGLREMERLVHPSSVSGAGVHTRRIRREGAYAAWVFFMLFVLSLAFISVILAALGTTFEESLILTISALTTTGPLIGTAGTSINLAELGTPAKLVLGAAMIVGRLETLAIITLFNPAFWRD